MYKLLNPTPVFITFTSLMTKIFPIKDAGDGKGTSKALLHKIAEKESEAQKSFMHRSVFSEFNTLDIYIWFLRNIFFSI